MAIRLRLTLDSVRSIIHYPHILSDYVDIFWTLLFSNASLLLKLTTGVKNIKVLNHDNGSWSEEELIVVALWRHRTTLSGYIFTTKVRIDNRKKTS